MDDIDNGPGVFKRTFVSLASGVVHVTVAVVVAGVLEGLFPPYRAARDELDIWIDLGVGTLEILTYVLLIGAVEMGLARWFSETLWPTVHSRTKLLKSPKKHNPRRVCPADRQHQHRNDAKKNSTTASRAGGLSWRTWLNFYAKTRSLK
jgi:ABC-type nickel/cobalt efflux system permease component RcnA